ncbi:hypothetical protein M422DRAFT_240742 [Sphaerobolus stellatus SS14]|nr:hypothetical protein M422DRAFT_240742 [Sphaerobolus stellatus SS14]
MSQPSGQDFAQVIRSAMAKDKDVVQPNGETGKSDSEAAPGSTPPLSPRNHPRLVSTPSARTGLPRSVDYMSVSSRQNTMNSMPENGEFPGIKGKEKARDEENRPADPYQRRFHRTESEFRGALEYASPEQREKEREAIQRKERIKRRETAWLEGDVWNPKKWLSSAWEEPGSSEDEDHHLEQVRSESPTHTGSASLSRSQSHPAPASPKSVAPPKWARLKSLLPQVTGSAHAGHPLPASQVAGKTVNITDELIAGGLSALMLRMWFERDERGARRIPVLLHRLRIRVSDSLHPLHGTKAVFRIECEYANGARWVIYRQLRDLLSLHAHYRVSNAYNRNIDALPDFPKTSLPYFKWLTRQNKERGRSAPGRSEFARLQREAIENYLVGLVRAVMFHPTSNRLSKFFEISALFIHLAQSGGHQAKAGVLSIEGVSGTKGAFGRKSLGWREKHKSKWCAVRESYLVVLQDPGELEIFEVFLLDQDFKIERPKRVYRQGFNRLLHGHDHKKGSTHRAVEEAMAVTAAGNVGDGDPHENKEEKPPPSQGGTLRKFRASIGRVFHSHHRYGSTQSLPPSGHRRRSMANTVSGTSSNSSSDGSSSSDEEDDDIRPATPLVDPSTNVDPLAEPVTDDEEGTTRAEAKQSENDKRKKKKRAKDVSKHTFFIENSQMKLKLYARNTRQMQQWIAALERTAQASHWTSRNRFDSFAPIRLNVAAQWLVDGRDYFWNLSRAILLAKETIYIHDWWLSPELQLRRPNKPQYRLDHLLERKAREGVKIFVIVYNEVSSRTTPIDSNYTKQRLRSLHENIFVQRSPSHFQTGTYYWAHHEKMCVIDEAIAFMGGFDLCFGRWDTAQHVLVDDGEMEGASKGDFIWPGKDYSNERVVEFHTLNKPEQDMYDRTKVPRMPWHDVGLQIVGPPARDLCRHFVQRWNYLLRNKNHSRVMPFLLPPPEFKAHDLTDHGLTGTCELQICRSAGPWSLGTPGRVEHSIQNAYLKAIQLSEHFVYIENQFFITSTFVNDVQIENKIGDAIVHRIIRAHREGTKWRAIIVIPSLPGFPSPIDQSDASAIRIILECQSRTIGRGPNSIFARLRKEDIDSDEYISFFSLRGWGKLKGDVLTTEQVYIHGKIMIVDDRLAIIGSANINERSQRGDRDSELASVIRDTDMIDGKMAGKPYKVGRFAHTLRVRLMREHLGVDVDAMYEEDLMAAEPDKPAMDVETWDPDNEQEEPKTRAGVTQMGKSWGHRGVGTMSADFKDAATQAVHATADAADKDAGIALRGAGIKPGNMDSTANDKALEGERQGYDREGNKVPNFATSLIPTLEEKMIMERRPLNVPADDKPFFDQIEQNGHADYHVKDDDDSKRKGDEPIPQALQNGDIQAQAQDGEPEEARLRDGSGQLYGAPADASRDATTDDQPPHARQGKDDSNEEEKGAVRARSVLRKHLAAGVGAKPWTLPVPGPKVDPYGFEDPICDEFYNDVWVAAAVHNTEIYRKVFHAIPDDLVTTWKQYKEFIIHHDRMSKPAKDSPPPPEPVARMPSQEAENTTTIGETDSQAGKGDDGSDEKDDPSKDAKSPPLKNRPSRPDEPFEQWEREEMEALLTEVRGHLVVYPTRFLEGEDVANNFLFPADRLLPLPIYV